MIPDHDSISVMQQSVHVEMFSAIRSAAKLLKLDLSLTSDENIFVCDVLHSYLSANPVEKQVSQHNKEQPKLGDHRDQLHCSNKHLDLSAHSGRLTRQAFVGYNFLQYCKAALIEDSPISHRKRQNCVTAKSNRSFSTGSFGLWKG